MKASSVIIMLALTLLYWYWESQAEGNIRVDLLVIYPLLALVYTVMLWRRFRFFSLLIAALLMLVNIGFFMVSYDLFDKYPG